MQVSDCVAVISGGASGLGRATVEVLVGKGARVGILDLNEAAGNALAAELGANAMFIKTDVSDEGSVKAALDAVAKKFGALHVAMNCAGIGVGIKTLGKEGPHPLAAFMKTINVNLVGTFNVARLAAELMAKNEPNADGERGVIINTASVAAFEGQVGQLAYSASKGGVVGMTLPMARDLSQYGIRVNTIAPGLFNTPLFATVDQKAIDSLVTMVQCPKRLGNPPEYGRLAAHIIENAYINGETIRIDAGIRMQAR